MKIILELWTLVCYKMNDESHLVGFADNVAVLVAAQTKCALGMMIRRVSMDST